MWILFALFTAAAAPATCPDDPAGAVRRHARGIEQAFLDLDDDAFDAHRASFDHALPCIRTPLEPVDAATLHRTMALVLFMDGDMRGSRKAWGALRLLDPDGSLPRTIAPEGHLLRTLFDDAPLDRDRIPLTLQPPKGWMVDGLHARSVPRAQSFVLQAADRRGITSTTYHLSLADIPFDDLVQPGPSPRARRVRHRATPAVLALGGTALASLGGYLYARHQLIHGPYGDIPENTRLARATGALSLGTGTAALVVTGLVWGIRW